MTEILLVGYTLELLRRGSRRMGGAGSRYDPHLLRDLLAQGFLPGEVAQLEAHVNDAQAHDVVRFVATPHARFTHVERLHQMQQFVRDCAFTSKNPDSAIAAQEEAGMHYALSIFTTYGLSECESYETFRSVRTARGMLRSKPDFATYRATFEITIQDGDKTAQILRDIVTEPLNPATGTKNPILLVAPQYSDKATADVLRQARQSDPTIVVYVIRDNREPQSTLMMASVASSYSAEQHLAHVLATLIP